MSEFTAGEDEITRQVIEYGGLFPFNVARMQKKILLPEIQHKLTHSVLPSKVRRYDAPAMTLSEKIFAKHMLNEKG